MQKVARWLAAPASFALLIPLAACGMDSREPVAVASWGEESKASKTPCPTPDSKVPVPVIEPASDEDVVLVAPPEGELSVSKARKRPVEKSDGPRKREVVKQVFHAEREYIPFAEKQAQLRAMTDAFFGGVAKNGQWNGFGDRTYEELIGFIRNARYTGRYGNPGPLVFPGVAHAIESSEFYPTKDIKRRVARALVSTCARGEGEPFYAEQLEKLPAATVAAFAYFVVNVGRPENDQDIGARAAIENQGYYYSLILRHYEGKSPDWGVLDRYLERATLDWQGPDEKRITRSEGGYRLYEELGKIRTLREAGF